MDGLSALCRTFLKNSPSGVKKLVEDATKGTRCSLRFAHSRAILKGAEGVWDVLLDFGLGAAQSCALVSALVSIQRVVTPRPVRRIGTASTLPIHRRHVHGEHYVQQSQLEEYSGGLERETHGERK